ncbi:MAG: adenylyltransferase/cytidyltransferase family protein [Anaerolineales bacterium]
MTKKVFVSGCFDLPHSGHVAFFQEAAQYGDLYVALGSDRTIFELKNRPTINTEAERLYIIKSLACVKDAFISKGSGLLDFVDELKEIHPDYFIVNEDGNVPEKKRLCDELGIEYVILKREPHPGLIPRSSTALRGMSAIPYRIDLAGGWLDQPFVSKHHPGPVLTISIHPTLEFNLRSGMATSTRSHAVEMWGARLPADNVEKLAKMLFAFDNPPGTKEISGSQDSIGIIYPGLAKADYDGEYWPKHITDNHNEHVLSFIENALYLIPLDPRPSGYHVLENTNITPAGAKALSDAAKACWHAAIARDAAAFGCAMREGFEAQVAMFPNMLTPDMQVQIDAYRSQALGWKVSGAGGGGYLILVADRPIENAVRISIRRQSD